MKNSYKNIKNSQSFYGENNIDNSFEKLKKISKEIRRDTIEMLYKIGPDYRGHPGPALSIVEILVSLYFKVLRIDVKNPKWHGRDRFILSKGHACPSLYVTLSLKGFFDKEHLYTFRHVNSILQGHPDMRKTPGIDMTSGSLGNGLGAGVGMAISAKINNSKYRIYVLIGDGEVQEGIVWESIMAASHFKLDNLIMIIDRNNYQSCNRVDCTIGIEPLASKLSSFNWSVVSIDGHDIEEVTNALSIKTHKVPLAIIANTVKGKGVSFMENNNSWHQRAITKDEYEKAILELS